MIQTTEGDWHMGFVGVPPESDFYGRGFIPGQGLHGATGFKPERPTGDLWWFKVEAENKDFYGVAKAYYTVKERLKKAADFLNA